MSPEMPSKSLLRLEWADFTQTPHDGVVDGPTPDDIRAIIEHLALDESGFVILAIDGQTFIQTAHREPGEPEAGLIVEHQQVSTDRHFTLDEPLIDAARAVAAFRAFFNDPAAIPKFGRWKRIEI